jgi:hypothetical protein
MPHPQFSTRPLLWLTLVVAAFLDGILCCQAINNQQRRTVRLEIDGRIQGPIRIEGLVPPK